MKRTVQDYTFERKQYLKIIVLKDEKSIPDSFCEDPPESSLLGSLECHLSQIVAARKGTLKNKDLSGPSASTKYGLITIRSEQVKEPVSTKTASSSRAALLATIPPAQSDCDTSSLNFDIGCRLVTIQSASVAAAAAAAAVAAENAAAAAAAEAAAKVPIARAVR